VNVVKAYLPQLQIDELSIVESEEEIYAAIVTIKYTVTDAVFSESDMVTIKL